MLFSNNLYSRIICRFSCFVALIIVSYSFAVSVNAQELVLDKQTTSKAEVLEIIKEEVRENIGLGVISTVQTIKVKILEGDEKDKIVTIDNDYLKLQVGDIFYLMHTVNTLDNRDYYTVSDPYRLPVLYFFLALFILAVIIFGGFQGLRGLASLIVSFVFILYFLLPGIMQGYSPILVSIAVSSLIIILGSYVTHGFNKTTSTAVLGMIITIIFTGFLAYAAVYLSKLSGFESEEAIYLSFDAKGSIDFVGLLLGGMMIGLLGVLYDAAIGQSIAVEELQRAGPHLGRSYILRRAIRMGREHIGALVNTLAIAYVGASLPLLLLFYSSELGTSVLINKEIFATEIVRTLVGSIGLVLTVPITSVIAAFVLVKKDGSVNSKNIQSEIEAVEALKHKH